VIRGWDPSVEDLWKIWVSLNMPLFENWKRRQTALPPFRRFSNMHGMSNWPRFSAQPSRSRCRRQTARRAREAGFEALRALQVVAVGDKSETK